MTELKISKIQLRRGPQDDLPGAPSSLEPVTLTPGLDEGEMGYATDTGRLFIGHEPVDGQPNHRRAAFPYQNLEILTEASTGTLRRVVGQIDRETGPEAFFAALIRGDGKWHNVLVGNPPRAYSFAITSFAAEITYALATVAGVAKRIGTLRVLHPGGGAAPTLADEALKVPPTDDIAFRLVHFGGSEPCLTLQVRNSSGVDNRLLFRVTLLPMIA